MIEYKKKFENRKKDDLDNYKKILENIFEEEIHFSKNANTNNCISGLNPKYNSCFKDNFINTLNTINNYFNKYKIDKSKLKETLKNIANQKGYYEWAGAYSEIVALGYLINSDYIDKIEFNTIKDDTGNLFENSLAKIMGQKTVDLDFKIEVMNRYLYIDVKSLSPTYLKLFNKIFKIILSNIDRNDVFIGLENHLNINDHISEKDIKKIICEYNKNKKGLIKEIIDCINKEKTEYEYKNNVLEKTIKFRISYYNKGLRLTNSGFIDPYKMAQDYEYRILNYYNKLLITKPSFIIFVINPWFSSEIYTLGRLEEYNKIFYRSLSRRIFIDLLKINEPLFKYLDSNNKYAEEIDNKITVSYVSKLVSGIIFIEDHSIIRSNDIYNGYVYVNPNANNKYNYSNFGTIFKNVIEIDNFEYDNY